MKRLQFLFDILSFLSKEVEGVNCETAVGNEMDLTHPAVADGKKSGWDYGFKQTCFFASSSEKNSS